MYEVNNQIKIQKYDKLQAQKVVNTASYEVLSISLEKEATFPTHTSPTDAELIVLEGNISFYINNEKFLITEHERFSFPKETEHWVKANENSKFLIIR